MSLIITESKSKSGKTIILRYPTMDDVEMITDFINKISAERTFLSVQGEVYTIEKETEWLSGVIKDMADGKYVYIMALDGDKIVGSTDIKMRSGIKAHLGVFGIVVDPEYRGDGIGELLMRTVIDEAKKNLKGLRIIILDVFSINEKAVKLYKKVGFTKYGELPGGLQRMGEFSDEISMYLKV